MSKLRFVFLLIISVFIAHGAIADEKEAYNDLAVHPKDDPGQYLKEILAHTYQFNPTIQAERIGSNLLMRIMRLPYQVSAQQLKRMAHMVIIALNQGGRQQQRAKRP